MERSRATNRFAGILFLLFSLFSGEISAASVRDTVMLSASPSDWVMEAEDPASRVEWKDGEAEIWAPKGLTLWYKHELRGDLVIEYDAMVVECDSTDRLSDLNCFWMATDPNAPAGSIWPRMRERGGIFKNCYSLSLYYVGYGGNYNSTTRFRRYDGFNTQPEILKEYTDADHLLRPNHWYHIRLECIDGVVRYIVDGETLVEYHDPQPLTHGWFGFRTTLAHCKYRPERVCFSTQRIYLTQSFCCATCPRRLCILKANRQSGRSGPSVGYSPIRSRTSVPESV